MKVCPSCKIKYEDDKKFCKKCGITLVSEMGVDHKVTAQRQVYDNRLGKTPDDSNLLFEYGCFLAEYTFYEEALVKLYQASTLDPENSAMKEKIIEVLNNTERYEEAAKEMVSLKKKLPDSINLLDKLITAYIKSGNPAAAQTEFEELLKIAPDNLEYLIRYRDLLKTMPALKEKLAEICARIIELNPKELDTMILLSDTLLSANKLEEARDIFRKIIELEPSNPRANLYIAIEQFERANPDEPETYYETVGLLQNGLKEIDKLDEDEKRTMRLYLSSSLLHAGKAGTEIKSELEEIRFEDYSDSEMTILSDCYVMLAKNAKEESESIHWLKIALELFDSNETRIILAEKYAAKGKSSLENNRLTEALDFSKLALENDPDNKICQTQIDLINGKKRKNKTKISILVAGIVVILIAAFIVFFFAHGKIEITVDNMSNIKIMSKDIVIHEILNSLSLDSEQLPSGGYRVIIQKDGYAIIDSLISIGFGRKTYEYDFKLTPDTVRLNEIRLFEIRLQRLIVDFDFLGKIGNHAYFVSKEILQWPEAKKQCELNGGHLVTISDKNENVMAAKAAFMKKSDVWIGLNDIANDGHWVWVTGESVTYVHWALGEPNNQMGEDYVVVRYYGDNFGKWNDEKTYFTTYYIMEIE